MDWTGVGISLLKAFLVFFGVVNTVPVLVWAERRGSAFIQHRLGPNRVNIGGFTLLGLVCRLILLGRLVLAGGHWHRRHHRHRRGRIGERHFECFGFISALQVHLDFVAGKMAADEADQVRRISDLRAAD